MRMVYDLLRLHFEEGASGRRIAESLGISRDTVADYLMRARFAGITWPLPVDADDAALKALLFPVETTVVHRKPMPDWAEVHKAMQKSGATLTALHEEYLAQHPDGMARSYFCQCYAEWRQGLRSYMRQTHVAGERVAVDYSGMLMQITGPDGEQRSAQIFVGVLGASSLTYVEAHWSQRLPDWIAAHVRMFEYFGCTPKVVVCDNLKAAVTKASRTEPQINDTYQHLARHYSMTVLPTRARKPKDKSKVENGVRLIQRWILFKLRHETFSSLEQLNAAIRPLLETLNQATFQKTGGSRRSWFEAIDRPAMRPLPDQRFEYAEFARVRVGPDGRFTYQDCIYSAPFALCNKEIDIRASSATVELLHQSKRVASHVRASPGAPPTIDPLHMTSAHRYFASWSSDSAIATASEFGEHVGTFMQRLLEGITVKELGYRATIGLRKMVTEFGADRMNAACAVALRTPPASLSTLRFILRSNLDRLPNADHDDEDHIDHENIRGADYYR